MKIQEQHISMVIKVNMAETEDAHRIAEAELRGFREALVTVVGGPDYAWLLMDCDQYYINQNVDRPMCCGVWLDWEPKCESK